MAAWMTKHHEMRVWFRVPLEEEIILGHPCCNEGQACLQFISNYHTILFRLSNTTAF